MDVRNEANPKEQSLVSGRSYLVEIPVRNEPNSGERAKDSGLTRMQGDNALRRHYEREPNVRNEANSPAAKRRASGLWERSYGAFGREGAVEERSQFAGVSSLKCQV